MLLPMIANVTTARAVQVGKKGELVGLGDNRRGQLGLGEPEECPGCTQPTLLGPFAAPVVAAACGGGHSVAALADGSCVSFGDDRHLQVRGVLRGVLRGVPRGVCAACAWRVHGTAPALPPSRPPSHPPALPPTLALRRTRCLWATRSALTHTPTHTIHESVSYILCAAGSTLGKHQGPSARV